MNKLVKRMFVAAMVLFALGIVTPIVVLSSLDGSARNKAGAATTFSVLMEKPLMTKTLKISCITLLMRC